MGWSLYDTLCHDSTYVSNQTGVVQFFHVHVCTSLPPCNCLHHDLAKTKCMKRKLASFQFINMYSRVYTPRVYETQQPNSRLLPPVQPPRSSHTAAICKNEVNTATAVPCGRWRKPDQCILIVTTISSVDSSLISWGWTEGMVEEDFGR